MDLTVSFRLIPRQRSARDVARRRRNRPPLSESTGSTTNLQEYFGDMCPPNSQTPTTLRSQSRKKPSSRTHEYPPEGIHRRRVAHSDGTTATHSPQLRRRCTFTSMAPPLSAQGVEIIQGFIDRRMAAMLYATLLLRGHRGEARSDDHIPTAMSFWGDATLDAFQLSVLPEVEAVVGAPLVQTYCYARLYSPGDTLARHHDREACEIVASVHLGSHGRPPPPICFATGEVISQQPGDAVVFEGAVVDHWRDTFYGQTFGQIFMNFVRADGQYRAWALDRRLAAFPKGLVPHEELWGAP